MSRVDVASGTGVNAHRVFDLSGEHNSVPSNAASDATPTQRPEPASLSSGVAHTAATPSQHPTSPLTGTWKKIPELSDLDGYGRELDLLGLGGIQKGAAMQIDGLEIKHGADTFEVFFLTKVPFLKVTEIYKLGQEVHINRRDLKGGGQKAIARQAGNKVLLDLSWGPPNAGTTHEEYSVDAEGQLCVEGTVTVEGRSESAKQVYRRQDAGQLDPKYREKRDLPFGMDAVGKLGGHLLKLFE